MAQTEAGRPIESKWGRVTQRTISMPDGYWELIDAEAAKREMNRSELLRLLTERAGIVKP